MNQRRYRKKIEQINSAFRKNLMGHPKRATKAFNTDLSSTIKKFNASQLARGMSNSQTNRQSSSGSATNQNRVIGGGSSGSITQPRSGASGLGGSYHPSGKTRYPTVEGKGGIHRIGLHPQDGVKQTAPGGQYRDALPKGGPAGGKPYVPVGKTPIREEPNGKAPYRLPTDFLQQHPSIPPPPNYSQRAAQADLSMRAQAANKNFQQQAKAPQSYFQQQARRVNAEYQRRRKQRTALPGKPYVR